MILNATGTEPSGIKGQNLVVKTFKTPLALFHQLGFEGPIAVPGHPDIKLSGLAFYRFATFAIAAITGSTSFLFMGFIAQMVGQLGF